MKIQSEAELAEKPFSHRLNVMGRQRQVTDWLFAERFSFRLPEASKGIR
jgi:hypothetical protein